MSSRLKKMIRVTAPILILLMLLSFEVYNLWKAESIIESGLALSMEQQIDNVTNKIESSYQQLELSMNYMSTINRPIQANDKKKWVNQATYIMDTFDEVNSISYVSTDLVVRDILADETMSIQIGDNVNDIIHSDATMQMWHPIYEEGSLKGFILSFVNLEQFLEPELNLITEDYVVDVLQGSQRIYETNDEGEHDQTKLLSRLVILGNNVTYRITMAPTSDYIAGIRMDNIVVFIFSLILTLIIILLFFISKKSSEKSISLEKTRNELVEKQEELYQMIILANAASEAKGEFLANMSHEIRTPISAIIGMNYLLSQTNLHGKQADYSLKIELASQNLLSIINSILDFSKIEAGKIEINSADFDMMDVIEHVVSLLAMKAQDKELEFAVNVSKDIPHILYGDSMRVEQVLINLIANAIKFTESGEVVFEIALMTTNDEQALIRFIVRDTGIGMTSDEQLKLFVEFEQAQKSIAKEYGGTGLGLSISKKLAELMGGSIEAYSKKGVGSEFYFDVPFNCESDQSIRNDGLDLNSLKVMIVDDSHTAAIILKSYIGAYMSDITIIESGEEAVEEYLSVNCGYDIILMDWKMPGMNGIEAARIISDYDKANQTKIVIVTAYLRDEVMLGLSELNIKSLLYKPVLPSKLFDLLNQLYGVKKLEDHEDVIIKPDSDEDEIKSIVSNNNKKILVVEDNTLNQQILFEILKARGYNVELANDGLEAVTLVKSQKFTTYDLIIMDLHMPKLNGYEATRLIYANNSFRRIPIIALTAEVLKDTKRKVLQSGMKGYLTKPINRVELFKTIETIFMNQQDESNILDVQEGIVRLVNNEEAYLKILRNFKGEYKNIYEELVVYLQDKDYDKFGLKIHSLKGLTGNISANKLYRCLMIMDQVVVEGDYDQINTLLDEFKCDLDELFTVIDYTLDMREPVGMIGGTIDKDALEFDVIKPLLDELVLLFDEDYGLVDGKVRELERVFINTKYRDQWGELEKRIGAFDVERATVMIEELLQSLQNDDN